MLSLRARWGRLSSPEDVIWPDQPVDDRLVVAGELDPKVRTVAAELAAALLAWDCYSLPLGHRLKSASADDSRAIDRVSQLIGSRFDRPGSAAVRRNGEAAPLRSASPFTCTQASYWFLIGST
jgi:hypothetical protein